MERVIEFASHNPILVLAFVAILGLFIFTEIRRSMRGYREVEPTQATRMINDGALVIDVRQPDVFKKGHVAGAANFPAERIDGQMDEINKRVKKAKGQPVLVYDELGMSGGRVASQLAKKELGVEIFNLKGGLTAWKRENMPVKKA